MFERFLCGIGVCFLIMLAGAAAVWVSLFILERHAHGKWPFR